MTRRHRKTANDVVVASGYGVRLFVERGHLVIEDGIADDRRRRRFSRIDRHVRRVVVLGQAGSVSLSAIQWMHDVGIGLVHINADGKLLLTSAARSLNDARLRRAQVMAASNGQALDIAKTLIVEKTTGQARLAAHLDAPPEVTSEMQSLIQGIPDASDTQDLMVVEGAVANLYWPTWQAVPVRFARKYRKGIPNHWRMFGTRSSALSGSQRRAVNPANAVLNYLYTIVEAEARLACLAVGLDPGVGLMHADLPGRDSLAFDVMEPTRPAVDRYVIDLIKRRSFTNEDFFETTDGNCRVMPDLATELAGTGPRWAGVLAPTVETVAQRLLDGAKTAAPASLPTHLTQRRRRAARSAQRRRPQSSPPPPPKPIASCRDCGETLSTVGGRFCSACWAKRQEQADVKAQAWIERSEQKRAMATVRPKSARDPAPVSLTYVLTILPSLRRVSPERIAAATGLTIRYCDLIRRGTKIPHERHWGALKSLGQSGRAR